MQDPAHWLADPVNQAHDEVEFAGGRCAHRLALEVADWRYVKEAEEMASMKRPRLRAVQARQGAIWKLAFLSDQHFTLNMSEDLKAYSGLKP